MKYRNLNRKFLILFLKTCFGGVYLDIHGEIAALF
nr:MAG TPA: hypothetical protein [Caudoviricetes sp.]